MIETYENATQFLAELAAAMPGFTVKLSLSPDDWHCSDEPEFLMVTAIKDGAFARQLLARAFIADRPAIAAYTPHLAQVLRHDHAQWLASNPIHKDLDTADTSRA